MPVFIVLGIYNFSTTTVFLRQNQSMFALVLVSRNLCAIKPTFVLILSTLHGTELELAIFRQITNIANHYGFGYSAVYVGISDFLPVCDNFRKYQERDK